MTHWSHEGAVTEWLKKEQLSGGMLVERVVEGWGWRNRILR